MTQIPDEPLSGPWVWQGGTLAEGNAWVEHLDEGDLHELETAARRARAAGDRVETLRQEDFPLPTLQARVRGKVLYKDGGFPLIGAPKRLIVASIQIWRGGTTPAETSTDFVAGTGAYKFDSVKAVTGIDTAYLTPSAHPFLVTLESDEFTCVCPKTGQPDFATIRVRYVPNQRIVESKSFKLYLWSYRDEGVFHEHVVNTILGDLVDATDPHWCEVEGEFSVRGGVSISVTAEHTANYDARDLWR